MSVVWQEHAGRAVVQEARRVPIVQRAPDVRDGRGLDDARHPRHSVRQWVLSGPFELRLLLARDPRDLVRIILRLCCPPSSPTPLGGLDYACEIRPGPILASRPGSIVASVEALQWDPLDFCVQ